MKKLTKKQKQANKRKYDTIKKGYETSDKPISYISFKHRVEARMKAEGLNVKEATKKELNTLTFTSAAERSRTNFIEGLKQNFKDEYKELRNLSRNKKGQLAAIRDNLIWDSARNGYILLTGSGKYFIDVTNSPEEVNYYAIQD